MQISYNQKASKYSNIQILNNSPCLHTIIIIIIIKYRPLIKNFENIYHKVKFINLSTSSLGTFGQTSESLFDNVQRHNIV